MAHRCVQAEGDGQPTKGAGALDAGAHQHAALVTPSAPPKIGFAIDSPLEGTGIRSLGPSREGVALRRNGKCGAAKKAGYKRLYVTWDRGFESSFLQRGVCKLSVPRALPRIESVAEPETL
jgi:hypothetical protein